MPPPCPSAFVPASLLVTLRLVNAAPHDTDASAAWMDSLRGRFIVVEGPDGSGKTTQFNRFVERARAAGLEVCDVREPGGTAIGERIRDLLLDNGCEEIDSCKDPEPDRCKQMHVTYTKTLPAEVFISSQARSVLKPIFSISQGGEKPIRKFPTSALAMDLPGFRLPNPSEGLQGLIVTLWQATCMSMKHGPCQDSIPFLLPVCLLSGPVRSCQVLSGPVSLRINS